MPGPRLLFGLAVPWVVGLAVAVLAIRAAASSRESDEETCSGISAAALGDNAQFQAVASFYGAPPPGTFMRGRHGVTHYILEEPSNAPADGSRRLVVLSHGIGTSTAVFQDLVGPLLEAGCSTLRYDFLAHGWSIADDHWAPYDEQVRPRSYRHIGAAGPRLRLR